MNVILPDHCPNCEGDVDYWEENNPGGPPLVGWDCCVCEGSGTYINSDLTESENGLDPFVEWLNSEIKRRAREIEDMAPRSAKGEDHKRISDTKIGINRGLRLARERFLDQQAEINRGLLRIAGEKLIEQQADTEANQ